MWPQTFTNESLKSCSNSCFQHLLITGAKTFDQLDVSPTAPNIRQGTQHNDSQHDDTQREGLIYNPQHK